MYVFGFDIPLVEMIIVFSIITIIILVELTLLIFLMYNYMRDSKKLGKQISELTDALTAAEKGARK